MHLHHEHAVGGAVIDEEDKAICPVMDIPVSKAEAAENGLVRSYRGKVYYLCCKTCVSQWDKDPEQYANSGDSGIKQ